LKLPFVAGSEVSKDMLQALNRQKESEIYETNFIRSYLEYKWTKVQFLAYFMMLIYFGYLINMSLTDNWAVILGWFIYFFLIFIYKLATSGQEDADLVEKLQQWADSFWNWTDLVTILTMIIVLIFSALDDSWIVIRQQMYSVLTLVSWIGFIQFLRFFKSTRILTAYIKASTWAMIPFLPIIFIMLAGFSLSFWIHEQAYYLGHGLDCDEECHA
jgi:hypothetical protein